MRGEGEQRFDAFVVSAGPRLARAAYALTGNSDDAADALQTALEKTWARWKRIDSVEDPLGYVHRVLANSALDLHRRRARRPELLTASDTDGVGGVGGGGGGDPAAGVADTLLIETLLATLSPRQRVVVVLRYLCDLSEQATADALGVPLGTVKSDASRAMARLRQLAPSLSDDLEDHHAH